MKALTVLATASIAGIVLTACGSEVAGTSNLATDSAATDTATPSASDEPDTGRLKKEIGEIAATGCEDVDAEGFDDCDVTFKVTSAGRDTCPVSQSSPVGDDEEIIRFTGEIKSASTFKNPRVETYFLSDNWSIEGEDGYSTNGLKVAVQCDNDPGPLYNGLAPGTQKRFDIAVIAPKGSAKILLSEPGDPGGFEWTIPAENGR